MSDVAQTQYSGTERINVHAETDTRSHDAAPTRRAMQSTLISLLTSQHDHRRNFVSHILSSKSLE